VVRSRTSRTFRDVAKRQQQPADDVSIQLTIILFQTRSRVRVC